MEIAFYSFSGGVLGYCFCHLFMWAFSKVYVHLMREAA